MLELVNFSPRDSDSDSRHKSLDSDSDSKPAGLGLESYASGLGLGLETCGLGLDSDSRKRGLVASLMKVHVQRISRTSFYQLRQLRSVRRSLSVNACTALVHACFTSRFDYCNSLLAGIGDGLIDQLQTVM